MNVRVDAVYKINVRANGSVIKYALLIVNVDQIVADTITASTKKCVMVTNHNLIIAILITSVKLDIAS